VTPVLVLFDHPALEALLRADVEESSGTGAGWDTGSLRRDFGGDPAPK
jgi:hypothetical protein